MKVLTTDELAERWGLTNGTLRNWRVTGRGPSWFKVVGRGGPVRYALEEVVKWEMQYGLVTAPRGRLRRGSARKTAKPSAR